MRKGGWGYAQDALRLLAIAGPALRIARFGLAKVFAFDVGGDTCTWISCAKALGITGTKHFATVQALADANGFAGVPANTLPAVFLQQLLGVMRTMGADATMVTPAAAATVEDTLAQVLKANSESVLGFSVYWSDASGAVGHTMIAYLSRMTGTLRILDRAGNALSLAEVETKLGYAGISGARLGEVMVVKNAVVVTVLENAALEVRSIPFRTEGRQTVHVPVRVAHAEGSLVTQTVCLPLLANSDTPFASKQACTSTTLYTVQPGDTLEAIARSAYGDPKRWRGIAAVNQIRDPARILPGTPLVIP